MLVARELKLVIAFVSMLVFYPLSTVNKIENLFLSFAPQRKRYNGYDIAKEFYKIILKC